MKQGKENGQEQERGSDHGGGGREGKKRRGRTRTSTEFSSFNFVDCQSRCFALSLRLCNFSPISSFRWCEKSVSQNGSCLDA